MSTRTSGGGGRLDGRVALVTGGSRGIGRGIALTLGAAGARVVVNYRRDAGAAEEVVRQIRAAGSDAIAIAASVDDTEALDTLVAGAREAFGDVDLLVHNAGIASSGNLVAETATAELQRVLATHAVAAHHLARLLLPGMRQRRRSDVVVISSSEVERMRPGGAPYNMAKSALEALALTLAKEESAHRVRVNIVAPGLVATDMGDRLVRATQGLDSVADLDATQPFGRVCRPEDVARVVLFLVGDDAAMVTGQRITVDGGSEPPPTGALAATRTTGARA
ncbi:MAG: family oxidoreductase [Conexibacter sp.]|nr:family oxidoreductase [Conexibacter sp.]